MHLASSGRQMPCPGNRCLRRASDAWSELRPPDTRHGRSDAWLDDPQGRRRHSRPCTCHITATQHARKSQTAGVGNSAAFSATKIGDTQVFRSMWESC